MIEFGKTLREAREQKGLTPSQIAETTHLLPQIVTELENEDFHRISAPIYGRGFVKLYCEAVGLEPKPLVDEFMAILNGERTPAIRVREVELPPEPVEPPPPPPPVYTQPELGDATAPSRPETPEDERPETGDASGDFRQDAFDASGDFRRETLDADAPRQYHPDYAMPSRPFALPPNLGRIAVLAGGALVILAALVWGIRALYRVTMSVPEAEIATEAESAAPAETAGAESAKENSAAPAARTDKKAKPAKKEPAKKEPAKPAPAKTGRTPKAIAPLYID